MSDVLRLLVTLWIVVVLARSGRNAWERRDLVALVWRGITWRAMGKALGLMVATLATASALLLVPLLQHGLGDLVNFSGNAVFTPLETAAGALGPAPASGPDWSLIALSTAFLGLLLVLLPWLAFVEEEVFRAGVEVEDLRGELVAALRFGLVHLVMLVPLAAALAISVAGFGYGRIYRHRVLAADPAQTPLAAVHAFRPTRRSSRAAAAERDSMPEGAMVATIEHTVERRQVAGVLASASVHTAFNATIVVLVWLAIVVPAANR